MSGHPKRAGTCGVLFVTAHAQLRNANAVKKSVKKTEHTLLCTITQKGEMTKNTVTNEEEERRQESKEARYRLHSVWVRKTN